jgi:hypothetical protein
MQYTDVNRSKNVVEIKSNGIDRHRVTPIWMINEGRRNIDAKQSIRNATPFTHHASQHHRALLSSIFDQTATKQQNFTI